MATGAIEARPTTTTHDHDHDHDATDKPPEKPKLGSQPLSYRDWLSFACCIAALLLMSGVLLHCVYTKVTTWFPSLDLTTIATVGVALFGLRLLSRPPR